MESTPGSPTITEESRESNVKCENMREWIMDRRHIKAKWQHPTLTRTLEPRELCLTVGGNKNGTAALEGSLPVSYKTKLTLSVGSLLPRRVENVMSTQKPARGCA